MLALVPIKIPSMHLNLQNWLGYAEGCEGGYDYYASVAKG